MSDTEPQIAGGQRLCHLLSSQASCVTVLDCDKDWLIRLHDESQDSWHGSILLLIHQSQDAGATSLNRDVDWLIGSDDESVETTDAVLGGRNSWDIDSASRPCSDWRGPIFLLTHLPKDAKPAGSSDGLST